MSFWPKRDIAWHGDTGQNEFRGYTAMPLGRMNSRPLQFRLPKRINTLSLISIKLSSRLLVLVEKAFCERTFRDKSTIACADDGHIPDRLGCSTGPALHRAIVDGHGRIESHKLPRTEDSAVLFALQNGKSW